MLIYMTTSDTMRNCNLLSVNRKNEARVRIAGVPRVTYGGREDDAGI